MTKKSDNIYIIFGLMIIFLISIYFFSHKEGFYGYDQQWNSPLGRWTPCETYFYSVEISPNRKKCCSNDSIWDETISLCHPECPADKIWNKKTSKCVEPSTQCPVGYSMYKGNGKCGNQGFTDDVDSNF